MTTDHVNETIPLTSSMVGELLDVESPPWHGAAWPFVLWGAYQGALLVVYRWAGERFGHTRWMASLDRPAWRIAGWALMFHLTCYGWLIFRADSIGGIARMTSALATGWGLTSTTAGLHALQLLFFAGPLVVLHAWEAYCRDPLAVPTLPVVLRYAVFVALGYLTVLFGEFAGAQFIYFQF